MTPVQSDSTGIIRYDMVCANQISHQLELSDKILLKQTIRRDWRGIDVFSHQQVASIILWKAGDFWIEYYDENLETAAFLTYEELDAMIICKI